MNLTYQHCPTSLVQISQQIDPKSNPLNLNFQDLSNNTKGTSQFLLLELNGRHSNVTTISTDFSIQNLVFWNLCEFSATEIIFKARSPTF